MKAKLLITAICSGFFALQGCQSSTSKFLPQDTTVAAQVPVEVTLVKKDKLSSDIKIPGELQAFQQVDLYAKINSYVKQLFADVGSEVKQGQLLATLEAPEINSQLLAAESKLKSVEAIYIASKANYDRLLETSQTPGTISPNDLDMAKARKSSDLAQLQAAKAMYSEVVTNRDYLQIRAPFSGIVSLRNASQGAYVGPSGKGSDLPMFTLQTQKKLRLVVSVPEANLSYLADKSNVHFTVSSLPGQVFNAQVKRLAGALDQRLRAERVEMDVDNKDKKLLPGMVAEISLPLAAVDSTLVVPSTAIINSTEGVYIVTVANGKAKWITVKPGRSSGKETEVFGQLSAGDSIVAIGTEELRNGIAISNTKLYDSAKDKE